MENFSEQHAYELLQSTTSFTVTPCTAWALLPHPVVEQVALGLGA